jgi:hypothetical protein
MATPHPIGLLLALPPSSPESLLRLRSEAVREVLAALARAPTLVAAARELGVTYRSLHRWRLQYPVLRNGCTPMTRMPGSR